MYNAQHGCTMLEKATNTDTQLGNASEQGCTNALFIATTAQCCLSICLQTGWTFPAA